MSTMTKDNPATVKFTEDNGQTFYTGKIVGETFFAYLVDSFVYGRFYIPKENCIIIEWYTDK